MLLMQLFFRSFARGPSCLMVRASDQCSEGLGFKSQLDPGFFPHGFISHSLSKTHHSGASPAHDVGGRYNHYVLNHSWKIFLTKEPDKQCQENHHQLYTIFRRFFFRCCEVDRHVCQRHFHVPLILVCFYVEIKIVVVSSIVENSRG